MPGGVDSPEKFWDLLINEQSGRSNVPGDRFNAEAFYHPNVQRRGTIISKDGYFLQRDPRIFDHAFFGISPLEAKNMDPEQRQLLEVVFECLEAGGIRSDRIAGTNTGCFVGNFTSDYTRIRARDPEENSSYALTGESLTMLSNRISYIFDLKGPR